jgi:hypothetical protein
MVYFRRNDAAPPLVLKAGDDLIPYWRIIRVDIREVERDLVIIHTEDAAYEARGFDAVEAVMCLRPSALEGKRIKWRSGAWALHNIVGHTGTQILAWLGYKRAAVRFHDWTTPSARDLVRLS